MYRGRRENFFNAADVTMVGIGGGREKLCVKQHETEMPAVEAKCWKSGIPICLLLFDRLGHDAETGARGVPVTQIAHPS